MATGADVVAIVGPTPARWKLLRQTNSQEGSVDTLEQKMDSMADGTTALEGQGHSLAASLAKMETDHRVDQANVHCGAAGSGSGADSPPPVELLTVQPIERFESIAAYCRTACRHGA